MNIAIITGASSGMGREFVYAVDKFLKTQGKYNKNEDKITFADVA